MKTLSFIVPVYNEEKYIGKVLKKIRAVRIFRLKKEIIVIDDGSTDKSLNIVQKRFRTIKLLKLKRNYGKGRAIKEGILRATGDIIVIQDADLEYDPENVASLIKPILEGKADVVYGSRFISHHPHRIIYYWHFVANQLITFFSNVFTNLNLSDVMTGYKAFDKKIVKKIGPQLVSNGFAIETELTAKIAKIPNIRIYEIGISYFGRTYKEGKKIKFKDIFNVLYSIMRFGL